MGTQEKSLILAPSLNDSGLFKPVAAGAIDNLLAEYQARLKQIDQVAAILAGDLGGVVEYFIDGNRQVDNTRYCSHQAEKIFARAGAVAALNASYWNKAIDLTDVYQFMPQKRRDEWNQSIHKLTTPDFTAEIVRPTLRDLLMSRDQFFAERVDGIFRSLSGRHVTNAPEGFGRRMILEYTINSFGSVDTSRCGYINDLRCVVAQFMGRDQPRWSSSSRLVEHALENRGQWQIVDGGAMRIRVYKCGTSHLEIHPDMVWRLNSVLAFLHPHAIPASMRQRPAKAPKSFWLFNRPLPFAVLDMLDGMGRSFKFLPGDASSRWDKKREYLPNCMTFGYGDFDKTVRAEAISVLHALGAVRKDKDDFEFPYDPQPVLRDVVSTGCIPDQVAHQFYPTPAPLTAAALAMLDLQPEHDLLEPSAGHGDLVAGLPAAQVTCIEVSPLHCKILAARGFSVEQADFTEWATAAKTAGRRFDRVLMNPPFSDGRAQLHLTHAAGLLKPGGRLVSILPASMRGKAVLPSGYSMEWSTVYDNEFAGTSVSVVILAATASSA